MVRSCGYYCAVAGLCSSLLLSEAPRNDCASMRKGSIWSRLIRRTTRCHRNAMRSSALVGANFEKRARLARAHPDSLAQVARYPREPGRTLWAGLHGSHLIGGSKGCAWLASRAGYAALPRANRTAPNRVCRVSCRLSVFRRSTADRRSEPKPLARHTLSRARPSLSGTDRSNSTGIHRARAANLTATRLDKGG